MATADPGQNHRRGSGRPAPVPRRPPRQSKQSAVTRAAQLAQVRRARRSVGIVTAPGEPSGDVSDAMRLVMGRPGDVAAQVMDRETARSVWDRPAGGSVWS